MWETIGNVSQPLRDFSLVNQYIPLLIFDIYTSLANKPTKRPKKESFKYFILMATVTVDNTIHLQYSGELMMFNSYICSLILKKAEKYKILA